jgi:hypothetical protein
MLYLPTEHLLSVFPNIPTSQWSHAFSDVLAQFDMEELILKHCASDNVLGLNMYLLSTDTLMVKQ